MPPIEARVLAASDLATGLEYSFTRDITESDVEAFAHLSGDHNPLHCDEAYARQTNYGRRIVHGAFQIGLASTMVGMYLPGRNVVVGSMRSRFPRPLPFPSTVTVHGEITLWMPQAGSGTVRVRVSETTQQALTAEIQVGFGLHENRQTAASAAPLPTRPDSGLPLVLLTGAASSIGPGLLRHLSTRYQMLGLVRDRARAVAVLQGCPVELVEADLAHDDWESAVTASLAGRPVYGIVHAAWPGAPQGGLLGLDPEIVARQVEFGSLTTIRLARWLVRHTAGAGRLVVLGTTAGTLKPVLHMAAYCLGKAAMEQTVRLLAPELASKNITINAVLPSFMPQGMNSAKTRHAILTETAKVPLGRLCDTGDVAAGIEFLLSEPSVFLTGQLLPLTGGQL